VKAAEAFFETASTQEPASTIQTRAPKDIRALSPVSMIQCFDAFQWPRLEFVASANNFVALDPYQQDVQTEKTSPLFGSAEDRATVFGNRLRQVRQRLLRSNGFKPSALGGHANTNDQRDDRCVSTLTDIDGLLGSSGKRTILGMLVQIEDGRFFLEDHNAFIPLDLSHTVCLILIFLPLSFFVYGTEREKERGRCTDL